MREVPFDPGHIEDPYWYDLIPGLDDTGLDSELVERIKDAVESLPDDERAVVECLVWGQMTKVEAAEVLGRTRQTVHVLWGQAQAKLRELLADG